MGFMTELRTASRSSQRLNFSTSQRSQSRPSSSKTTSPGVQQMTNAPETVRETEMNTWILHLTSHSTYSIHYDCSYNPKYTYKVTSISVHRDTNAHANDYKCINELNIHTCRHSGTHSGYAVNIQFKNHPSNIFFCNITMIK